MGCGCQQQNKTRGNYDNIKKLAVAFAKDQGVLLALYEKSDGTWSFLDIESPEFCTIQPSEFVSALQRMPT